MKLSDKDCQSCKGNIAALTGKLVNASNKYRAWEIIDKYGFAAVFSLILKMRSISQIV